MNDQYKYRKYINILTLLFISFFNITNGFKLLSNLGVEIITTLVLFLVCINSKKFLLSNVKSGNILSLYFLSAFVTSIILIFFGIHDTDRHALQVAYFFILTLIFIYLMDINFTDKKNYENFIKYYAYFILVLASLNIITFIQVVFFHLPASFSITLGNIQPRTFEHFLTGVVGESSRYISFFGEPSDFLWISASGLFVLLKYNFYTSACIVIFSMLISGSGSILPAFFLILLYLALYQKNQFFSYLLFIVLSIIFIYFFSEVTFIKFLQRWIDSNNEISGTSKLDHMINGHYASGKGEINSLYTFFPHKITDSEGLNYLNNFFYVLGRIGYLSVPFFLTSLLLILLTLRKLLLSSDIELFFGILCFLLLLVSRAAFHFLPVFWFFFLCVYAL